MTISQDGLAAKPGTPMLEATITRLDRAASFEPDVVCLPETFSRGEPETVPGPTTHRLSAWASEHACYVICPLTVRDGARTFNSAVLIDRRGAIVGRYDKIRAQTYAGKVRVTWYHDDDLVSVASLDRDLTVEDIISEFDLTPHPAYLRRAQQVQDERRRVLVLENQ